MSDASEHPEPLFDLSAAPLRVGRVRLRVRDLAGTAAFYSDILGLAPMEQSGRHAVLGAGGRPLLELIGDPRLAPLDRRQAGLYHTAFLLPDRASLGRWLRFARARRIGLDGAADHAVSEAVYLADPEGNGIEIYVDRPVSAWRRTGAGVEMTNDRLDLEDLLAAADDSWTGMPAGSVVGHVHLQVGDTGEAEHFYGDLLGFSVTCRFAQASFFGAGGYHHQLAANTWHSGGAGQRPKRMVGLDAVELVVRDGAHIHAVEVRARGEGTPVEIEDDTRVLRDPWGTLIILAAG
ncbi:VOC family protein [Sabulicella glaciei]|uniref:VOC family protein n=1 Tax=Sabulicella glaciei TaxID=2984948 RepID=A0ABT3P1G2_9PROT|nr:VOC family protein [Roseococcus sp. MDT2-1-1]MCW8088236.1 VOC family protein [Roseococcus sp. MDT2-1-1]